MGEPWGQNMLTGLKEKGMQNELMSKGVNCRWKTCLTNQNWTMEEIKFENGRNEVS